MGIMIMLHEHLTVSTFVSGLDERFETMQRLLIDCSHEEIDELRSGCRYTALGAAELCRPLLLPLYKSFQTWWPDCNPATGTIVSQSRALPADLPFHVVALGGIVFGLCDELLADARMYSDKLVGAGALLPLLPAAGDIDTRLHALKESAAAVSLRSERVLTRVDKLTDKSEACVSQARILADILAEIAHELRLTAEMLTDDQEAGSMRSGRRLALYSTGNYEAQLAMKLVDAIDKLLGALTQPEDPPSR